MESKMRPDETMPEMKSFVIGREDQLPPEQFDNGDLSDLSSFYHFKP